MFQSLLQSKNQPIEGIMSDGKEELPGAVRLELQLPIAQIIKNGEYPGLKAASLPRPLQEPKGSCSLRNKGPCSLSGMTAFAPSGMTNSNCSTRTVGRVSVEKCYSRRARGGQLFTDADGCCIDDWGTFEASGVDAARRGLQTG
jgi:hypothetical protein